MSGGGARQRHSATLRGRIDAEAGQALVEYLLLFTLVIIGLFSLVSLITGPVTAVLQQAAAALQTIASR